MWESWPVLWSFVYPIYFQTKQIPAANHYFSCEKSLLLFWSRFLKKKFFLFEILLPQASKQKKTYFATKKILQNFEGHDHWHCQCITFWIIFWIYFFKVGEIMLLKYGNLMLPAGHILDLYCAWLWNVAPFLKNYAKLYFDAKHLKKGLNRVKFLVPFFQKKCSFWPILNTALNF